MGEPCGTPTGWSLSPAVMLLKLRRTFLFRRNALVQLTNCGAYPKLSRIAASQSWFTLSKNPHTSKSKMPTFRPAACAV